MEFWLEFEGLRETPAGVAAEKGWKMDHN